MGEADLIAVGVAPRVLHAWRRFSLKRSPAGQLMVDCPHCDELVDPTQAIIVTAKSKVSSLSSWTRIRGAEVHENELLDPG